MMEKKNNCDDVILRGFDSSLLVSLKCNALAGYDYQFDIVVSCLWPTGNSLPDSSTLTKEKVQNMAFECHPLCIHT